MDQIQTQMPAARQLSHFTALLSGAWLLFRSRFKTLAAIVSPSVIVGILLSWLWLGGLVGSFLIVMIAGVVLQLLSGLALIKAISSEAGFLDAYKYALKNVFSYLWFAVLMGCILIGGLLLGFIPGVIFSIWFIFGLYVLVAENQKGMNALIRSKEYVRGYWWKVFWTMVLISALLSVVFGPIVLVLDQVSKLISNLAGFVLSYLASIFSAVFIYRLYQDFVSLKPEIVNLPVSGKRGFFVFAGIIGLLFSVIVLWALFSAALPFFLFNLNLG